MYPVEADGARIRLREVSPDLTPALWRIVSAEEGILGPPGVASSEEELRDWLLEQHMHARSPARIRYRWAIERLEDAAILGGARLYVENQLEGQGSIGYALAEQHRGMGYGTEAATLALQIGFELLGLHRIWATIEPGNTASMKVADNLRMRREGLLQSRIKIAPGDWRDAYLYAITEDEWRAR